MDLQNKNSQYNINEDIDLSEALDDVVAERRQIAYQETKSKKKIPEKKKKIYILIIIVSWFVFFIFLSFLLSKNKNIRKEVLSPDEILKEYQNYEKNNL